MITSRVDPPRRGLDSQGGRIRSHARTENQPLQPNQGIQASRNRRPKVFSHEKTCEGVTQSSAGSGATSTGCACVHPRAIEKPPERSLPDHSGARRLLSGTNFKVPKRRGTHGPQRSKSSKRSEDVTAASLDHLGVVSSSPDPWGIDSTRPAPKERATPRLTPWERAIPRPIPRREAPFRLTPRAGDHPWARARIPRRPAPPLLLRT
jgi:hypothetical protein